MSKTKLSEELRRMKNLMVYSNGDYKNPLREAVETTNLPSFSEKVDFGGGWYTLDGEYKGTTWNIPDDLKDELSSVKEFLLKNPSGYIVDVRIDSGESKIPNVDATGKKGTYPSNKVPPKYLSNERMKTIKDYVTSVFDTWVKEGVIKDKLNIVTTEPVIGKTEWVGQEFCPEDKRAGDPEGYKCTTAFNDGLTKGKYGDLKKSYVEEQYVKVEIKVNKIAGEEEETPKEETSKDPLECATNLKIRIWVPSHNCQNAEFFVYANNTSLKNTVGGMTANLNNSDVDRGIPRTDSQPTFQSEFLNPGYGYLPNGDGTYGYKYGSINKEGNLGGGRSDTFILSEQQVKDIINENQNKNSKSIISLWMIATTSNAHKDIPNVTITLGDKVIYNKAPKITKGKILSFDVCTNKVVESSDTQEPDLGAQINKIVREKRDLQEKNITSGKVSKKKQMKLDQKGVILERSEILLDKITSLLSFLSKNIVASTEVSDDVKKRLSEDYTSIQKELKGDENSGIPSLEATWDGEKLTFVNKTIRNSDLYGDIRMDLTKFYKGFIAVYYRFNKFNPKGIPTEKDWAGNVDGKKLLERMKSSKISQEFGLTVA